MTLAAGIASAHRLDEYLQATLLSIAPDRVDGSMRLIPGQAIAPAVAAAIDTDRDGTFSASEQRACAERVLHDQGFTTGANAALSGAAAPGGSSSASPGERRASTPSSNGWRRRRRHWPGCCSSPA